MIRKTIVVEHDFEDYSKLASSLVQKASRFSSLLWIEEGAKRVNAKSIMGVLSMHFNRGDSFDLICNGGDEEKAAAVIEELFTKGK